MSDYASTEALCGHLAQPERLRVFAAVTLGARSTQQIVQSSGVAISAVGKALVRLRDGGLVSGADGELTAHPEKFKEAMRESAAARPAETLHPDPIRNRLLVSVIRDGRIRVMPEAPAKVRMVLEHVVTVFEPGIRYTEPEINQVLRRFHDDHAMLRRYLVDHALMAREDGVYRRTG